MFLDGKPDALAFPVYPCLPFDKTADVFMQNMADWTKVLTKYQEGLQVCASEGTKHYEDRHKERGLLLGTVSLCRGLWLSVARDRVHLLLDPDTPFLELGAFAGYNLESSSPSASLITGIGVIWYNPLYCVWWLTAVE